MAAAVQKSNALYFTRPVSFSAATVDCEGSAVIQILADGAPVHSEAVSGYTVFRLPPVSPALR
ncbi:MAG: hypothetical protein LBR95_00465 [Azoarcus sp.]|jgi:hypothetical protein|nr:hypothetical protein [Azoarcus sp.]